MRSHRARHASCDCESRHPVHLVVARDEVVARGACVVEEKEHVPRSALCRHVTVRRRERTGVGDGTAELAVGTSDAAVRAGRATSVSAASERVLVKGVRGAVVGEVKAFIVVVFVRVGSGGRSVVVRVVDAAVHEGAAVRLSAAVDGRGALLDERGGAGLVDGCGERGEGESEEDEELHCAIGCEGKGEVKTGDAREVRGGGANGWQMGKREEI